MDARDPVSLLNEWYAEASDSDASSECSTPEALTAVVWADRHSEQIGELYRELKERLARTGSHLLRNMTLGDFYGVCVQYSELKGGKAKLRYPA